MQRHFNTNRPFWSHAQSHNHGCVKGSEQKVNLGFLLKWQNDDGSNKQGEDRTMIFGIRVPMASSFQFCFGLGFLLRNSFRSTVLSIQQKCSSILTHDDRENEALRKKAWNSHSHRERRRLKGLVSHSSCLLSEIYNVSNQNRQWLAIGGKGEWAWRLWEGLHRLWLTNVLLRKHCGRAETNVGASVRERPLGTGF